MSPQRAQSPRAVTKASLSVAHQSRIESVRDPEDVPSECPTPTLPPPPRLVARGATGDGRRATGDGRRATGKFRGTAHALCRG
jgi:hypothetical protein